MAPLASTGASATWKGPSTVFSVAPVGRRVIDRVHQHRDAEDIRQQDELLPPVRAGMAGFGQELDGGEPFLLRRLDLLHGGVQVPHDHRHDLGQSGVLCGVVAADHHLGAVGFGEVAFFGCSGHRDFLQRSRMDESTRRSSPTGSAAMDCWRQHT